LLGRKVGMTRIFNDDGESVPVTVLDVGNNRVTQIRQPPSTIRGGPADPRRSQGVTHQQAAAGHFAKAGVEGGSRCASFASIRRRSLPSTPMP